MGNCCKSHKSIRKKIVLLLVGLDNAGKTVAAKGLAGEDLTDSVPTVGFSVVRLKHGRYEVEIFDLGGGPEIRGIWHRYFVDAHGIIFVVDASDFERLDEAKTVLEELLSHEKISGKPVLLLANKQDNVEALDEIDIVDKLQLEILVNEKKCPTLVESCSANAGRKVDRGIRDGYNWLLTYIMREYTVLNNRVEQDVKRQQELDTQARLAKMKQFHKTESACSDSHDVILLGDPFRPIQEIVNGRPPLFLAQSTTELRIRNSPVRRPQSAIQIVKRQLAQTTRRSSLRPRSNKTAPATFLEPRIAPLPDTFQETPQTLIVTALPNAVLDNDDISDLVTANSPVANGHISNGVARISCVTFPNAIVDSNGDNIGDLFQPNSLPSPKRLPPLKTKTGKADELLWLRAPLKTNVDVIQIDSEEIQRDVA